tara:strand:- start:467 stop:757 length:291 start_codon:yes stop_codon:yes gene_type:complete
MLVRLTEVCNTGAVTNNAQYSLREVYINPEHVVMVREEQRLKQINEQNRLVDGLDSDHRFSKLTIDKGHTGTEIVVVGAPDAIENILKKQRQLLRG